MESRFSFSSNKKLLSLLILSKLFHLLDLVHFSSTNKSVARVGKQKPQAPHSFEHKKVKKDKSTGLGAKSPPFSRLTTARLSCELH